MGPAFYTLKSAFTSIGWYSPETNLIDSYYCLHFIHTKARLEEGDRTCPKATEPVRREAGAQMQEGPVLSHHDHQLNDWRREFKRDGCEDSLGPSE